MMAQEVKELGDGETSKKCPTSKVSSILDSPVERQRQSSVELPSLQFLKQPSAVKDANLN